MRRPFLKGSCPLVAAAVLLLSCPRTALGQWDHLRDDLYLGGIEVNEPDKNVWHAALEEEGLDTISMTVYARHQAWDGAEFTSDADPAVFAWERTNRRHHREA